MDRAEMQAETRTALSVADELSREEHQRKDEDGSQILAALRTALRNIDLDLGATGIVRRELVDCIHHLVVKMRHLKEASVRPRISALLFATEQLEDRLRGKEPRELDNARVNLGVQLIAAGLGAAVLLGISSFVLRSRRRR
ncbi:MAG: hypothetical protein ABIP39_08830 [Polyangiaceae bacterium]